MGLRRVLCTAVWRLSVSGCYIATYCIPHSCEREDLPTVSESPEQTWCSSSLLEPPVAFNAIAVFAAYSPSDPTQRPVGYRTTAQRGEAM